MQSVSTILRRRARIAIVLFALFSTAGVWAAARSSEDIFKKWLTWQHLFGDDRLDAGRNVDAELSLKLWTALPVELRPQLGFIGLPTGRQPTEADFNASAAELKAVYREIDSDMGAFVARLQRTGFSTEALNQREESGQRTATSEDYRMLLDALLSREESKDTDRALLAAANRMYEYAFSESGFPRFRQNLDQARYRSIARLFWSNIWYHLSGTGWRYWHEDALNALRTETDAGKEVVYIAGGTDIYHLIRRGVYRIRNIDPIFPSQTKYYSEGWEFLIKGAGPDGGLGDEIAFSSGALRLKLKRTGYVENGSFQTPTLSNQASVTIPISTTTWKIYDAENKEIGYYILERRFATQEDFTIGANRALLISFNELAYVADPGPRGWGIDPSKFARNFVVHVKQLRKPVSRAMILNMRAAEESDFSFIRLGTSID